jgi:Putative ABC exporter
VNRALWLLIGMNCIGWGRSLGRNLRTIKGALLAIVGLSVLGFWLWAVTSAPRGDASIDPEALKKHGPAVFVTYCLLTVLMSRGERAIYFSPAEVNFLFVAPFTRRQLLVYKITVSALIAVPTTLFLAMLFRVHARWTFAAFVGLYCAVVFMQVFAIAVSLIGIMVGTAAYTRGRKLLLLGLGLLVAVLLFQNAKQSERGGLTGIFAQLEDSPGWKAATAPLGCFIEAFLVEQGDWPALAKWGALSAGVTLFIVMLVLLLDAQYLESVASNSERIYSQIQKFRRGEAVTMHWRGSSTVRWGLPGFPFWGGVGPVAWRQATTGLRSLGRLALVVLILAPVMIGPLFAGEKERDTQTAILFIGGLLLWMSMLLTTLVPFDFRGDLDRMDLLKTLPLPAWRIVLGQLLTPVLILGLLQGVSLIVFWIFLRMEGWAVLCGLAFAAPLNLLLFGLDNLLFLWFPSRMWASNPGDFQALGRNVLIFLTKVLVLGIAGMGSAGLGSLAWLLTGYDLTSGVIACWVGLCIFAFLMVPVVAVAFRSFDVSRDVPA